MPTGDFPPPEGMIWSDALGWIAAPCAGCKKAIQMPGTYLQVRGKNYHEQCVWKCVGHGYGNHAPITVTKQPEGSEQ